MIVRAATVNESQIGAGELSRTDCPILNPLAGTANKFYDFVGSYAEHFVFSSRTVEKQARDYLCGLIQAERKNMERMAEVVPNSDDQALQHFLTYSPWSAGNVMDHVARDIDNIYGNDLDTCLIIDETGCPKKGERSVGVDRQWCGQLGKTDNCQVGVFSALCCGNHVAFNDCRLYLPESWTKDMPRCEAAGIPKEYVVLKSKCTLAFEMIVHARSQGIRFNWIGVDGGYGKDPALLRKMHAADEIFVADVHKDQRIYLQDPKPIIPEVKMGKGRKPTRLVAQSEAIRVDKYVAQQAESKWKAMAIREGTKGRVMVEILHERVWLWDGMEDTAHEWHLVVRREMESPKEIKYSLSNAAKETITERLAFMQGQRYWVERSLQDAKVEVGLGDYQVRKWDAWHHHMALVMMAMLFLLQTRISHKDEYSLLSCHDITILLAHFLPRRDTSFDEILRQMEVRHKKRQELIDGANRRQELYMNNRRIII